MDRLLREALRSMRSGWQLTLVMVAGLGCGIGLWGLADITSRQPRRDSVDGSGLYQVAVTRDYGHLELPGNQADDVRMLLSTILTQRDADAVAAMAGPAALPTAAGMLAVAPEGGSAEEVVVRGAPARLLSRFGTRFKYGGPWEREGESGVVIAEELNERWFGGGDSRGRILRAGRRQLRVVGVLGPEDERRRFDAGLSRSEELYLSWGLFLDFQIWPDTFMPVANPGTWFVDPAHAEDSFVRLWLDVPDPAQRVALAQRLSIYADAEKAAGRMPRVLGAELVPYPAFHAVVNRTEPLFDMFRGIGLFALAACTLNLVRLLVVRFGAHSAEVAIRRALGASRRDILSRHLLEAGLIGALAGVLGISLCAIGVPLFDALIPSAPVHFFLDKQAAIWTVLAGPAAAVIAALYPSWRSTRAPPAAWLRLR